MPFEWNPNSESPKSQLSAPELHKKMVNFIDFRSQKLDEETRNIAGPLEMSSYSQLPLKRERYSHENLDIDFIGAIHSPETFLAHREEIEKAIKDADFVILEGSIETSGTLTAPLAKKEKIVRSFTDDKENIAGIQPEVTHDGHAFFFEIENIAKKHGRQVVCMDPWSDERMLQSIILENSDHIEQKKEFDKIARMSYKVAPFAAAGGIIGAVNHFIGESSPRVPLEQEKDMSRREFIKRGAGVLGSALLMKGTLDISKENINMIDTGKGQGGSITHYNFRDYRDVAIAEGIDRLSKAFSRKMKAVIIYGLAHKNEIFEYLNNSSKRSVKYAAYTPYRQKIPLQISAYRYDIDPSSVQYSEKGELLESSLGKWKRTLHWQEK